MHSLEVLDDLVKRGKAVNAATRARAARANELAILEVGSEPEDLLAGDLETYDQLGACVIRILGLAAPIAAAAINPKRFPTEDVGNWVASSGDKPTGKDGWQIHRLTDQRLWLYRGERARLVQQRCSIGMRGLIQEAMYRPSGQMDKQAWEMCPAGNEHISVGPFYVTDEARSYIRYCGAMAAGKAFFAFCAETGVIDAVNEGVAKQLAPAEAPET